MNPILKNILVFFAGCILGMCINMGLIITGNLLIPLADGVNPMDATMWELKYFLFPFLAHAVGTFIGAFIIARYTAKLQYGIIYLCWGVFSLRRYIYGIYNASTTLVYYCRHFHSLYTDGMAWMETNWAK